jgi:hypothetical protein
MSRVNVLLEEIAAAVGAQLARSRRHDLIRRRNELLILLCPVPTLVGPMSHRLANACGYLRLVADTRLQILSVVLEGLWLLCLRLDCGCRLDLRIRVAVAEDVERHSVSRCAFD